MGIELAPLLTKIKVDIAGFKSEMEQAKQVGVSEAKKMSDQLSGFGKTGESMSKIGGTLTKAVTAPLIGVGIASGKMALDFETSFAKVSTLLDDNAVNFDNYKSDLLSASNESKIAVGEFSEAVYGSISAGVDQTKAIEFTTNAMKLAKGGFTDGAKAVDVLTTAINGYKLSTDDTNRISDMLITTQNLGKTTVDELASSMGKVIPIASTSNFRMEELSASYALLTKNGIATAESGTMLKAMLSEIGKSGSVTDEVLRKLTEKGFADLKAEGRPTADILSLIDEEAKKNGKTLKDMFSSVEAGTAALVLSSGEGQEYNEMLKAMESSAGATQKAFDKMDATPMERINDVFNRLKNSGIKLGTVLLPIAEKGLDKLEKTVDWMSKLDEAQLSNIAKWGMLAVSVGPALKVLGGGMSLFAKLAPAIQGASAALGAGSGIAGAAGAAGGGGLIGSLGATVVAAGPAILAIAAIGATGIAVAKELQKDVIPEVDLFADTIVTGYDEAGRMVSTATYEISQRTKDLVGGYMEASDSLQREIGTLYSGVAEINGPAIDSLAQQSEGLAIRINTASSEMKQKELDTLTTMFSDSKTLTVEQQQEILTQVTQGHIDRETKTNALKDELLKIYDDIRTGSGQITEEQLKDINLILDQMKEDAVSAMTDNKIEQEAILGQLKLSHERVNTEMVSDAVKKLQERHKKTVDEAQNEYKERLKVAENLRKDGTQKSKDAADAIIKEAERQYKETVAASEKIRDEGLSKIDEAYGDLTKSVDRNTGEILTFWQKIKNWWSGTTFEKKTAVVEYQSIGGGPSEGIYVGHSKYTGSFNGLDFVPYDGYYARLHKGERVLTAEENKAYSQGQGFNLTQNIYTKVEDERLMQREAIRNLRELLPQV